MLQQDEMVGSSGTFSPDDVHEGDTFFYLNGNKTVCGCVGEVCSHNDGSLHVIHDPMGSPVCAINGDAPRRVSGDTVYVTAAGRAVFAYRPQQSPS